MSLEEKFGLPSIRKEEEEEEPIEGTFTEVVKRDENMSAIADFEEARKNVKEIIKVGTDAVKNLGDVAESSQLPEYYLSLSAMIKVTVGAASSLVKLHEQIETLKNPHENKNILAAPKEQHSHIHFSGSTAELGDFVKSLKKPSSP